LIYLYQNALAFVFPTLYEGFGIPILESFACGCPAVLSNTSSLPEVGGDAAVYFDPQDMDSIKTTVMSVIYNEKKRHEMVARGYEQLNKFSWAKTAQQVEEVYISLLSTK
jgi:glycosyltransferase involved in cell wall biosynthesis